MKSTPTWKIPDNSSTIEEEFIIVLPQAVIDKLQLQEGDKMLWTIDNDIITLAKNNS